MKKQKKLLLYKIAKHAFKVLNINYLSLNYYNNYWLLMLMFFRWANINYQIQSKYFEDIRSVSSIIFGVSGAWLAISYPKALLSARNVTESTKDERQVLFDRLTEDNKLLNGFIQTMIVSIIIITVSIAIPIFKEIISNTITLAERTPRELSGFSEVYYLAQ